MEGEESPRIRATFEYGEEDRQELWNLLGPFVSERNITVEISYVPADKKDYNPELITWLYDEENRQELPIVTRDRLKQFVIDNGSSEIYVSKIFNLFADISRPEKSSIYPSINKFVLFTGGIFRGFRADLLDELINGLEVKHWDISGLGDRSIKVLGQVAQALKTKTDANE